MSQTERRTGPTGNFQPTPRDIDGLIARAVEHPLGTQFIVEGALDAVAATFQVHAFTVEAARSVLRTAARESAVSATPPATPATSP